MAKYIVQVIVFGLQVTGRAVSRTLQQEYAAFIAVAQAGGNNRISAKTDLRKGMNIQDKCTQQILMPHPGYIVNQYCAYSQTTFDDVFSESSKENFINCVKNIRYFPSGRRHSVKEAAVMVPLCIVNGKPSVLFTVRSALMGRNKGDVSFPGGMKEISDKDAIHAALRETKEEIGISADISEIWTVMNPFPNRSGNILITPVIAFIGHVNVENCQINTEEVESVFSQTLESLCNHNNWRYTQFKNGYILPVYLGGEHRIWGFTAGVLHVLLQALLPGIRKSFKSFRFQRIAISKDT